MPDFILLGGTIKLDLADLMAAAGMVILTGGLWSVSPALALIVLGLILLLLGVGLARRK